MGIRLFTLALNIGNTSLLRFAILTTDIALPPSIVFGLILTSLRFSPWLDLLQ